MTEEITDWKEQLPEDMRGDVSLKDIADIPALAKSYIHAQGMVGADKVVIPKDGASDEEMTAFYTKLGRPETSDKYEIKNPDNIPEGFPLSEDLVKGFRENAHKLGLSSKQAGDLYTWFLNDEIKVFNDAKRENEEAVASATKQLRTDWAKAFDTKVSQIETMINTYGDDDLRNYLKETGVNNDARFIRFLGKVAENFGEDTLIGKGHAEFGVMTPEAAQARIAELKGDKDFMARYQNRDVTIRKEAVKRMQELYEFAYPTSEK